MFFGNVPRECSSGMFFGGDVARNPAVFFVRHAKLPGCPGVSGAAESQTQTMFVMSYRTLHSTSKKNEKLADHCE